MNHYILTEMGRERRDELRIEYARGDLLGIAGRAILARALRAAGDRLFRLGVALDERVSAVPNAERPLV